MMDFQDYKRAKTKTISQYRTAQLMADISEAIFAELYELRDVIERMPAARSIMDAEGTLLEYCGSIYNVNRPDLRTSDSEFRSIILAEIAASRSNGLKRDLERLIRALLPFAQSVKVLNYEFGDIKIEINIGQATIPDRLKSRLAKLLERAAAGDARIVSILIMRDNSARFSKTETPATFSGFVFPEVIK